MNVAASLRGLVTLLVASVLLSACGNDSPSAALDANASAISADATAADLAKGGRSTRRGGGSHTNKPPTLSGTALTSATVGTPWSFTPTAADPEGAALRFSIANLPSWAVFSASTGALSGTPGAADAKLWPNITISVSDGKNSTSLTPFSVTVAAAAPTTGSATLSWTPPNANVDASPLTDLAGYKIYYGKAAATLDQVLTIADPRASQQTITNLVSGSWYFAMTSVSASGIESALSQVASKTIH